MHLSPLGGPTLLLFHIGYNRNFILRVAWTYENTKLSLLGPERGEYLKSEWIVKYINFTRGYKRSNSRMKFQDLLLNTQESQNVVDIVDTFSPVRDRQSGFPPLIFRWHNTSGYLGSVLPDHSSLDRVCPSAYI